MGKTPVPDSLFSKIAGVEAYNFIKKQLQQRCFSMDFVNFLWTRFLQNTSGRLLLKIKQKYPSSAKAINVAGKNFALLIEQKPVQT